MDIAAITSPESGIDRRPQAPVGPTETSFADVLKHSVGAVNDAQIEASETARDFTIGEGPGIHQTMIAMEKADVSLRLLTQVRNKAVEAYQEIMRMQM